MRDLASCCVRQRMYLARWWACRVSCECDHFVTSRVNVRAYVIMLRAVCVCVCSSAITLIAHCAGVRLGRSVAASSLSATQRARRREIQWVCTAGAVCVCVCTRCVTRACNVWGVCVRSTLSLWRPNLRVRVAP
jgi:hypothetical protein